MWGTLREMEQKSRLFLYHNSCFNLIVFKKCIYKRKYFNTINCVIALLTWLNCSESVSVIIVVLCYTIAAERNILILCCTWLQFLWKRMVYLQIHHLLRFQECVGYDQFPSFMKVLSWKYAAQTHSFITPLET